MHKRQKTKAGFPGSPVFPREHGAWGIILGAFFSVAALTHHLDAGMFLLLAGFVLLYLASHQIFSLHRAASPATILFWAMLFGLSGLGFLIGPALWRENHAVLYFLGLLPVFAFVQWFILRKGWKSHLLAHLLGVIGLTSIAPLTSLFIQTEFSSFHLLVWLINVLFFGSGILFVRHQIALLQAARRDSQNLRETRFLLVVYHLMLIPFFLLFILSHNQMVHTAVAFLPTTLHAFYAAWRQKRYPSLKTVGWIEMAHTLVFVLLLAGLKN